MRRFPPIRRLGAAVFPAAAAALCLAACAPDPVLPERRESAPPWVLVNPRPFDIHITDLWGPSPDRMFAVGLHGGLLVREGTIWRRAPSATTSHIWDIHGCDWEHVYAVSDEGLLFFDGKRWRREGPGPLDRSSRVFCNAPDDVMVATQDEVTHHFDGNRWTVHLMGMRPDSGPGDWLAGDTDGRYLAVGRNGAYSLWDGSEWRSELHRDDAVFDFKAAAWTAGDPGRWRAAVEFTGARQVQALVFAEDRWKIEYTAYDGLFVGMTVDTGSYLLTTDQVGEAAVPSVPSVIIHGPNGPLFAIADVSRFTVRAFADRRDPGTFALVGGGPFGLLGTGVLMGGIPRYGEFALQGDPVPFSATDLLVWPSGDFAAADSRQRIVTARSGALGITPLQTSAYVRAIWSPGPGIVYAVANAPGGVGELHVVRGDLAAVRLPIPELGPFYGIGGLAEDDLWIGSAGRVLHWDGADWTSRPWDLAGNAVSRVVALPTGEVFAITDWALGRWDGGAWSAAGPAGATSFVGIAADRTTGDLLAIVRNGGNGRHVMRRRDGEWQDLGNPGDVPTSVVAGPGGSVWVDAHYGLYCWQDGAWSQVTLPGARQGHVAGNLLAGDPEGGIYLGTDTGGIHHLDLGGLGLWR